MPCASTVQAAFADGEVVEAALAGTETFHLQGDGGSDIRKNTSVAARQSPASPVPFVDPPLRSPKGGGVAPARRRAREGASAEAWSTHRRPGFTEDVVPDDRVDVSRASLMSAGHTVRRSPRVRSGASGPVRRRRSA